MKAIQQAIDAWRESNRRVTKVESDLSMTWKRHIAGQGPPPPVEELMALALLRREARVRVHDVVLLWAQHAPAQAGAGCGERETALQMAAVPPRNRRVAGGQPGRP